MISLKGLILLAVASALVYGCSKGDNPTASSGAASNVSSDAEGNSTEITPPATEFVTLTDPVENAYTIDMPKGWSNRTYTARVGEIASQVDTTISPNGSVLIFAGDPYMGQYWNPDQANEMTYLAAKYNPAMKIEPFRPASEFFPDYVQNKFGKLPDFQITSSEDKPEIASQLQAKFDEKGMTMQATCAEVRFTYTDNGKPMQALIQGFSSNGGAFWVNTVVGVTTWKGGKPESYMDMINAMARTRKMSPEWQQAQQRKHEQTMAQIQQFGDQMTAQHNANMNWIQQSAASHQQRMQAIWSANDASMRSFNERMASSDAQHSRFLNYINDENTVIGPSGKSMQVDNSYQRYYVNKNDNTYIGGDITMDQDKLRSLGLNPDDYEEAKIKQ